MAPTERALTCSSRFTAMLDLTYLRTLCHAYLVDQIGNARGVSRHRLLVLTNVAQRLFVPAHLNRTHDPMTIRISRLSLHGCHCSECRMCGVPPRSLLLSLKRSKLLASLKNVIIQRVFKHGFSGFKQRSYGILHSRTRH